MRFLAKFLVFLLSLFGVITVVSYFYGYSITFPFTITEDTYVPEHRLHAVRLATFTTFFYFGFRYLFFGSTKLHPIQFLGVFLFNLGVVGGLCFYVNNVDFSEYTNIKSYGGTIEEYEHTKDLLDVSLPNILEFLKTQN